MNIALPYPVRWEATDQDSLPTRTSLLGRLRDLDDEVSWRTFFDTYWRLIYNVARKSGLTDTEAQDIVQETVIAVARKLPDFRYDPRKGSFKNWLLLITRRRIHDHLRRAYRSMPANSREPSHLRSFEEVQDDVPSPDAQTAHAWEEEWRETLLRAGLEKLREGAEPKQYQVFDLCAVQRIAPKEVAKMLGMNRAQVYLSTHRLTARLRRLITTLEAELNRPGVV
jgi:RNA polymerase sigma-70 factor (ECF subfamily)